MRSIDLTKDRLIPLAEAARKFLPKPPGPAALWRWHRQGVLVGDSRVRLETVRVGRARYTTEAAFRAFVERTNREDVARAVEEPNRSVDLGLKAAGLLR